MSEAKQFTFTLSRAHKITERLKRHSQKLGDQVLSLAKPVVIFSNEQASEIDARLSKIDTLSQKANVIDRLRTTIRVAIAEVNGQIGQHQLLTEQKDIGVILREKLEFRKNLAVYGAPAKPRDQLAAQLTRLAENKSNEGVSVKTFTDDRMEKLDAEISDLTAKLDRLNDQVADNNASNKIVVQIPVDLAAELGLA